MALIVLVVVFFSRKKKAKAAAAQPGEPVAPGGDEISVSGARSRGQTLRRQARTGRQDRQPPGLYLLMGESGGTKTSVMIHSGLDPELLAGQVYQNADVVPTRAANLWFSRRSIFAEAGGKLLADSGQWSRFVRKLQPRSSRGRQRRTGAARGGGLFRQRDLHPRRRAGSRGERRAARCAPAWARFPRRSASIFRSMCCSPRWTGCRSSPSTCAT